MPQSAAQAHAAIVPRQWSTLKRGRSAAKAGGKATAKNGAKAKAKKGAQKETHELTPDEKVERAIVLYSEANIKARRLLKTIHGAEG